MYAIVHISHHTLNLPFLRVWSSGDVASATRVGVLLSPFLPVPCYSSTAPSRFVGGWFFPCSSSSRAMLRGVSQTGLQVVWACHAHLLLLMNHPTPSSTLAYHSSKLVALVPRLTSPPTTHSGLNGLGAASADESLCVGHGSVPFVLVTRLLRLRQPLQRVKNWQRAT